MILVAIAFDLWRAVSIDLPRFSFSWVMLSPLAGLFIFVPLLAVLGGGLRREQPDERAADRQAGRCMQHGL